MALWRFPSSSAIWENIEKLESEMQRSLLQWQLRAREPIHRFSDIKAGDHLVRKGTGSIKYEHHFLCVGFDSKQKPQIIHYSKTRYQKKMVQKMTLPHKDFIKNEGELQAKGREVKRVVWPKKLRRFSVQEVITRAWKNLGEDLYHLTMNNCESFVMWCLCGVNISLQVTPAQKAFFERRNQFRALLAEWPLHVIIVFGLIMRSDPTSQMQKNLEQQRRLKLAQPGPGQVGAP